MKPVYKEDKYIMNHYSDEKPRILSDNTTFPFETDQVNLLDNIVRCTCLVYSVSQESRSSSLQSMLEFNYLELYKIIGVKYLILDDKEAKTKARRELC